MEIEYLFYKFEKLRRKEIEYIGYREWLLSKDYVYVGVGRSSEIYGNGGCVGNNWGNKVWGDGKIICKYIFIAWFL